MNTPFGQDSWAVQATPWRTLDENMQVREFRPLIRRPLDCPFGKYERVYRPMKYEYEGACVNYDYTRIDCVYCGAAMMSNALMKIPYDVRARCDEIMGW